MLEINAPLPLHVPPFAVAPAVAPVAAVAVEMAVVGDEVQSPTIEEETVKTLQTKWPFDSDEAQRQTTPNDQTNSLALKQVVVYRRETPALPQNTTQLVPYNTS